MKSVALRVAEPHAGVEEELHEATVSSEGLQVEPLQFGGFPSSM
jgi:hypothetical protein